MLAGIVMGFMHETWRAMGFTLFHTGYVWWQQAVMDWKVQIHVDLARRSNKTCWPDPPVCDPAAHSGRGTQLSSFPQNRHNHNFCQTHLYKCSCSSFIVINQMFLLFFSIRLTHFDLFLANLLLSAFISLGCMQKSWMPFTFIFFFSNYAYRS